MCDDFTAVADDAALAKRGLNRREFAAISAATFGAMGVGATAFAQDGLTENMVSVPMPDGTMDAMFVHPSDGAHAAVIMWPDIAGLRPGYMMMARTLAARGFAVLAVNHYYRSATAPVMESISEFFSPEGRQRLGPMIQAITLDGIASDANAIVTWLDGQDAVDSSKKIGTEGYCMTGSYAIRTAAAVPERIGAASSFHGGGLVTDAPTSPHRLFKPSAYYLIAIAKNDYENAPHEKDELRLAAEQAGAGVRVELFQGDHGWCAVDSAAHHEIEAKRAREMSVFHYEKL